MDYSEPLIECQQWLKCYADAMRAKRWDIAEGAAVKIVRIGVDLIDHAEAIAVQKRERNEHHEVWESITSARPPKSQYTD